LPGSNIDVFFVDCPELFARDGIYTNDEDEDERFILFQNAVIISLQYMQWAPDVVHCNDWQCGLIPAYIRTSYSWDRLFSKTTCVQTIHNIAYQGLFNPDTYLKANINKEEFLAVRPFELNKLFCFLKAGIYYSDEITTVSPTYAKEIMTLEYGTGLEGILKLKSQNVTGILNGIDINVWSPERDTLIPYNYSSDDFSGKLKNKREVIKLSKIINDIDIPIIGMVTRFAWQKGLELLEEIFDKIIMEDVQFIILGEGEEKYEEYIEKISKKYKEKVFAYIGYNNELAHLITAGSDIFLMPSKYEPCGLNQMYSLNYGTIPVVRKTGGLADTVRDADEYDSNANGFTFKKFDSNELYFTIKRALKLFKNKQKWDELVITGMGEDFSWGKSAKEYLKVYKKLNH
jgi:starch synthase